MNPAEFSQSTVPVQTQVATSQQQQGSAWVEEGDKTVDATIHLGAGDRRTFKFRGTLKHTYILCFIVKLRVALGFRVTHVIIH